MQDALGVPAFSTSEEAFAAEDLFNAYRSGDAAAVKAVVAKPLFKTIDNQARVTPATVMLSCRQLRVYPQDWLPSTDFPLLSVPHRCMHCKQAVLIVMIDMLWHVHVLAEQAMPTLVEQRRNAWLTGCRLLGLQDSCPPVIKRNWQSS